MRPHISTIVSHVDRNIPHNADAVTTAQTSYLFPLPEEFELGKPVKLQLGRQFVLPFLQSSRIPSTDSSVPMHPGHIMMDFLACHEERIILLHSLRSWQNVSKALRSASVLSAKKARAAL